MMIRIILLCFLIVTTIQAQELQIEQIPDLFFDDPVDLVSTGLLGDDRLFVLEKKGRIMIIDDINTDSPTKIETPFLDIQQHIDDGFEGGLLGLAFHPNYQTNGYFYVNYTHTFNDQFYTRISRFRVSIDDENIALGTQFIIMDILQPKKNHNGGDLAFGPDGYLYIPMGDGGGANDIYENGQDRQSLLGKVLRIDITNVPYTIPEDNPFVGTDETLDEIWSLGWRNPWKVSFDRATGDFWAADVGQNEIEEVDMEPAGTPGGRNYGWNCFEGSVEFDPTQCQGGIEHTPPVFEYDQSQGWKSITGGYVYRGSNFPDLLGHYIFTDYEDSGVFWLTKEVDENTFDTQQFNFSGPDAPSSVATFGESNRGELYFASLDAGTIWRISTLYTSSTEAVNEIESIDISPNPAGNRIVIRNVPLGITEAKIMSITGKAYPITLQEGGEVNIDFLTNGVYFLQIRTADRYIQSKFTKGI